jgi:drug/metabolite transporter (DMT)-like permease
VLPLGIAYMVGSTVMFAGGNAVVKWQLASYPLGEVAFGRTLFAFLSAAAIVLPRAGWGVLRTRRYRDLQRGLSQFGSMLLWFLAVSVLSLGSATAIGLLRPATATSATVIGPGRLAGCPSEPLFMSSRIPIGSILAILDSNRHRHSVRVVSPSYAHVVFAGGRTVRASGNNRGSSDGGKPAAMCDLSLLMTAFGADRPIRRRSTNAEDCPSGRWPSANRGSSGGW